MARLGADAADALGTINGFVDIVGMARFAPMLDIDDETWDWEFDICLRHAYLLSQEFGRRMVATGGGTMVFIASVSGFTSAPNHAAYGAAKAGLMAWVQSVAVELGPQQIRANAVAPGTILTPRMDVAFDDAKRKENSAVVPARPHGRDVRHRRRGAVLDLRPVEVHQRPHGRRRRRRGRQVPLHTAVAMTDVAAGTSPGMRIELQREIVGRLLAAHDAGETQLADEPLAVPAERLLRPGALRPRAAAGVSPSAQRQSVCRRTSPSPATTWRWMSEGCPSWSFAARTGPSGRSSTSAATAVLPSSSRRESGPAASDCGFHGWTYDLDGRLIATPYGDDGFTGLDRACLGLMPVPVEEAFGLVFVRAEGEEAIDADAWLGGAGGEVGDFQFGQYHPFDVWSSEWACNWKLLLDTFLEAYHVFALHADTVARYFLVRPSAFEPFGPHLRFHSLQKSLLELKGTDPAGWELLPHGTVEYLIAPATVLSHSVDHLALYRFLPLAADRTAVEATLYTPSPVETERQASHFRKTLELHQRVSGDQDFTQQVKIQRSLATGRVDRVLFGRNEPAAIHFHRSLEDVIAR